MSDPQAILKMRSCSNSPHCPSWRRCPSHTPRLSCAVSLFIWNLACPPLGLLVLAFLRARVGSRVFSSEEIQPVRLGASGADVFPSDGIHGDAIF